MRFTVAYNPKPNKIICETDSINEACWSIYYAPQLEVRYDRHFRRVPTTPGMLAHEAGEQVEVEPGYWARAWERSLGAIPTTSIPAHTFVLREKGAVLWLSDQEVIERACRWERHVAERALRARAKEDAPACRNENGFRPVAYACRHNRCRSAILAEHSYDEDVPPMRPGARVPDWWWEGPDDVRISKCWKDQSRRRHQWRPIEL